jgi:hemerythrin-like metal-binding protein
MPPLAGWLSAEAFLLLATLLVLLARKRRGRAARLTGAAAEPAQDQGDDPRHQKLESLRLLASGIAHDFNNLLGAMVGNLELARSELDPKAPAQTHLAALEQLLGRASHLVAQILAYSGKGKAQLQALDLNRQAEEITRVLRASLAGKASLRWEPAPGLPPMEGDLAQIQQVITNLVLNAFEAVDAQGGVITVRTGSEQLTEVVIERAFQGQPVSPGPHVTLQVTDNGSGMAPEVKERIFDPFFTTKLAGRGMGLSAVQGILRSHQGGIQVSSREGEGTTFTLLFPAADAPARVEEVLEPWSDAALRGTGVILVADDEDALRTVAVSALRRLGFDPLEARDGLEALQVYEANRDRIRLVLMDLTMPRMDGEEAYRALRRAGAMVPIILSSGFGQEEAYQRFRAKGLAGFLQKPYRLQDLDRTVRDALEGKDGRTSLKQLHPEKWVVWSREFETGHPLIDQQHQTLVKAFNELAALAGKGEGPERLNQALAHIIDVATTHFGIEEGLMAGSGYAQIRAHRAVHALLTSQIQDLAWKLRSGGLSMTPLVVNFLGDWVVCHLTSEDRHLARHLKTGGH